MPKYVLVVGNPGFGFAMVGPFDDQETAMREADSNYSSDYWWVMPLVAPED